MNKASLLRIIKQVPPSWKSSSKNSTQESSITYIRPKYRQRVWRRMIFEILTGIKMLNVSSFCSVIFTSSGFSLDSDHTLRFNPLCGLKCQLPSLPRSNSEQEDCNTWSPWGTRLRQLPEYPKPQEKRTEAFRAQLTAFQMISTRRPGDLTRGRIRMVMIPLFLLFRALPKEFLHLEWCDVFCCGFVYLFFLPLSFSFSLNFVMVSIAPYSPIS